MTNTTRNTLLSFIYCGCVSCAVGMLAAPANAATDEVPKRIVRFGDLDISRPEDAKVLYHRIRVAAHEVCAVSGRKLEYATESACVARAVDEAVRKVDSVMLTDLHFGKGLHLAAQ
jgi:UrcA family protein